MKLIAGIGSIFMLVCVLYPVFAEDQTRTTEEVLKDHHNAVLSGDIEAVLRDYAESAVIITPTGKIEGIAAIREFFGKKVPEYSSPDFILNITTSTVNGNVAFVVWNGETNKLIYDHVVDTMVVENGKIVTQAASAMVRPKTVE